MRMRPGSGRSPTPARGRSSMTLSAKRSRKEPNRWMRTNCDLEGHAKLLAVVSGPERHESTGGTTRLSPLRGRSVAQLPEVQEARRARRLVVGAGVAFGAGGR